MFVLSKNLLTSCSYQFPKKIAASRQFKAIQRCNYSETTTVNEFHVATFSKESENWWDINGNFRMLHFLNNIRVPFIKNGLLNSVAGLKDLNEPSLPLKGLKLLDIGCGGGILTEALAKLGADIVGVDASIPLINIAKQHANLSESLQDNLSYELTTIEEYWKDNEEKFDALIISEVIEHINQKDLFINHAVKTLKKEGSVFVTTFNSTYLSWIFGIHVYENIFRTIPKGSHQWDMFIAHEEMKALLKKYGCLTKSMSGAIYNPITEIWSNIKSPNMMYLLHAIKN